jgi:hypothetical protein
MVVLALAIVGPTSALPNDGSARGRFDVPEMPEPDFDLALKVVERENRFDRKYLEAKPCPESCVVRITVFVPKNAKHKHGVGIDGGDYESVDGVPVKPGRYTSLTVTLQPGKYVVYDSYKRNRKKKGYRVRLTAAE